MQSGYRITSTNNTISASLVAAPTNYFVTSQPVQGPAGAICVQPAAEAAQVVMINQPPRTQNLYVTTPQMQPNAAATAFQMVQLVPVTGQQQNSAGVDVYMYEAKTLKPTGKEFYDR